MGKNITIVIITCVITPILFFIYSITVSVSHQKTEYCYIQGHDNGTISLFAFIKNGSDRQLYKCSELKDCIDAAKLLNCEVK